MGTPEIIHIWPYSTSDRPCTYCDKSWRQLRAKYNGTVYYESANGFMTKIGQTNAATGRTIWTWLCPNCKEQLEEQVAKPIDYLDSHEQVAAATIRLVVVLPKEEQEQNPEEALTAT